MFQLEWGKFSMGKEKVKNFSEQIFCLFPFLLRFLILLEN